MLTVVPDYYAAFRCIGGQCRHNCCIGWEIDIDEETLSRYRAMPGDWGERLVLNVGDDGSAHFITDAAGRCPFLNGDGLCDLQLAFGDDLLCDICAEHPRFHNELPGRIESGLGLCCEAAAHLILGQREPTVLCISGTAECDDEIIAQRDKLLVILQDRSRTIDERITSMLISCHAAMPGVSPAEWARVLLSLERLDDVWGELLIRLRDGWNTADTDGFDAYMADRQTEYEQLLVYFIYRHLANAADDEDIAARACFAVLGYTVIHALGAVLWTADGHFDLEQQCELARAFSAEIEYSYENLYILLNTLGGI